MTTPKYSNSGYLGHIFSMDVAWKLLQDVEDALGLPGDGFARLEPLVVDHDPLVVVRSGVELGEDVCPLLASPGQPVGNCGSDPLQNCPAGPDVFPEGSVGIADGCLNGCQTTEKESKM